MISSQPDRSRSGLSWASLALLTLVTCFLGGCATNTNNGTYHVDAYAPVAPDHVQVLVSLNAKMVYVMEDGRPLMVTPTSIGTPDHPTPTGHFTVEAKDPTKRSSEYGFWVNGSTITPGAAGAPPGPGWSYVGYPMADWVQFEPGFGFHEGYVWPVPRSHGCLRLHRNAAGKFYQLVKIGTPVTIAQSLPEDETLGRNAIHPTDYKDPDPPAAVMISPDYFTQPRDTMLIPTTPTASPATAPAPPQT